MQRQQLDTHERIQFVLDREGRPLTTQDLLPEVMPVKTDLEYSVSTGIGQRRCYAECCIQTHLLWLIEQGKVERVMEKGKVAFSIIR
jgi:hypothetical protein